MTPLSPTAPTCACSQEAVPVDLAVFALEGVHLPFDRLDDPQAEPVGLLVRTVAARPAAEVHQGVDALVHADQPEQPDEAFPLQEPLLDKKIRPEEGDLLGDKADFRLHEPAGGVHCLGQAHGKEFVEAAAPFGDPAEPHAREGVGPAADIEAVVAACDSIPFPDAGTVIGVMGKRGVRALQRAGDAFDREFVGRDRGVVEQREIGDGVLQLGKQLNDQLPRDGGFGADVGVAEAVAHRPVERRQKEAQHAARLIARDLPDERLEHPVDPPDVYGIMGHRRDMGIEDHQRGERLRQRSGRREAEERAAPLHKPFVVGEDVAGAEGGVPSLWSQRISSSTSRWKLSGTPRRVAAEVFRELLPGKKPSACASWWGP